MPTYSTSLCKRCICNAFKLIFPLYSNLDDSFLNLLVVVLQRSPAVAAAGSARARARVSNEEVGCSRPILRRQVVTSQTRFVHRFSTLLTLDACRLQVLHRKHFLPARQCHHRALLPAGQALPLQCKCQLTCRPACVFVPYSSERRLSQL